MNSLSKIFAIALLISAFSPHAFARIGNEGSGGGDLCEDRIKVVRDDLKTWIQKNGSKDLELPSGITNEQYKKEMLSKIDRAKIRCVGKGDEGYPVNINGTPKVCRFDKDTKTNFNQITCDYNKFTKMNEEDQYVLIHHEYAGLADIEIPEGDDSNYDVSNQISDFLVDVVVKKLAVKSEEVEVETTNTTRTKYEFVADNSYWSTVDKVCVPSVFRATVLDDVLIISTSLNSLGDIVKLTKAQAIQFKNLSNREWGKPHTVSINHQGSQFLFKGESCGRLQCDSLEITNANGEVNYLENPIHGLDITKLRCP